MDEVANRVWDLRQRKRKLGSGVGGFAGEPIENLTRFVVLYPSATLVHAGLSSNLSHESLERHSPKVGVRSRLRPIRQVETVEPFIEVLLVCASTALVPATEASVDRGEGALLLVESPARRQAPFRNTERPHKIVRVSGEDVIAV